MKFTFGSTDFIPVYVSVVNVKEISCNKNYLVNKFRLHLVITRNQRKYDLETTTM